jgi:hypothetical protein
VRPKILERMRAYQARPEKAYRIRVMHTRFKAKERGMTYALSEAREKELFSLDARCHHCGAAPQGVKPLGADRLDPDAREYTDDGVVPCCKPCNFARGGLPLADFYRACRNVAAYQRDGVPATEKIAFPVGKQIRKYGVTFATCKARAATKKMAFELTKEAHARLQNESACYLCGVTGGLGIDRKDNTQGYTLANSFPCCTCCNMMKNKESFDAFVSMCSRVSQQHLPGTGTG